MACSVKVNRHGFLAFHLFWKGLRSWEGTGLEDTSKNRKRVEARAVLMTEEIEKGEFDYLRWFPNGNKAYLFKPKDEPVEQEPKPQTVGEYYLRWIERKRPPMVRKSLERDYRQHFVHNILPQFEDTPLRDVTLTSLDDFRSYLVDGCGLSLKSCRNIIDGSFRAMMKDARKRGLIDGEPFKDLEWPRRMILKPDPFTGEERNKIIAYFKEKYPVFHPFVLTLFWTGMRPSEATGLKWGDVDLKHETVEIQRSRHLGVEDLPKTPGSQRTIHLLPNVVGILQSIKPLHATEGEYVFTSYERHPIDAGKWAKCYWSRALRAKKIRPRKFYAYKHTYISVALSANVNIKWLAEQCGTSVAMIEKHYGRYINDDGDAPLRALLERKSETLSETFLTGGEKYLGYMVIPTGQSPVNFGGRGGLLLEMDWVGNIR